MNKTIFITGISGSGKSTAAKKLFVPLGYEAIHLDEISKYYQKGRPIKNQHIKQFIDMTGDINFHTTWEKDDYMIINSFIKWITNIDGKFVVEGVHLFMPYIDRDYLSNYKIFVMGTSSREATMRRLIRGFENDVSFGTKIKNIIKYDLNPVWIIDDIKLNNFKRYMKKRNKKLVVL